MTIARAQLVDTSVTRWYHFITRCVRRAFLLGEGDQNRKVWIENRLEELAEIFAVAVGGFSVMDQMVDYTGRLFRHGKATISAELTGIFERLGCSAQNWRNRIEKLRDERLLGRFFATTRAKLREIAERLGLQRVLNLAGCPVH